MSILGEAALSALLQALFDKLVSTNFLKLFPHKSQVLAELKKWETNLKIIYAVLDDAEEKQMSKQHKLVKLWLDDLKDLAYDVEDILDEFATDAESLQRKLMDEEAKTNTKNALRKLIPSCCTTFDPRAAVHHSTTLSKMKGITERLETIIETKKGLGLIETVGAASSSTNKERQRDPTSCLLNEPRVFGRDKDKEKILEFLLRGETSDGFGVIPIVGMGGVGKTTLAQLLYNDEAITNHFDLKGWVCVSDDEFHLVGRSKAILEAVTLNRCDVNEYNQVVLKLNEALKGKRFLLVLDDVWKINGGQWHSLRTPFMSGASGSKIIVTTRITEVAETMGTVPRHHLECISDDDCWSLFKTHAFRNSSDGERLTLEIKQTIIKRCDGLPLAARTLGGLLRSKQRDEWQLILNNNMWNSKDDSGVLPVLQLSYHHLPSHLKRCFAYCAILPKDYEFEEEELVLLWMAEGLIQYQQGDGDRQMEVLGSEYFHDLVWRSIFQQSSNGKSHFVMHDLVNDLAQKVAGETCFRLEDICKQSRIQRARHSSYLRAHYDGIKKFEPFNGAKSLRTFLPLSLQGSQGNFLSTDVLFKVLANLKYLRVLSLNGYMITELPDSIGDLKLLRYFDLSRNEIKILPKSTTLLYNLETLILEGCNHLEKLPSGMENLTNLHHLVIPYLKLLEGIPIFALAGLKTLRTCKDFVVHEDNGFNMTMLGSLKSLRGEFRIWKLENVNDASNAGKAKLQDKNGIDVLSLGWSIDRHLTRDEGLHEDILTQLEPQRNLKVLSILNYCGTRFPAWVGNPLFHNLESLSLLHCVNCTFLPQLGILPFLKKLSIGGMSGVKRIGCEFYGESNSNPFPVLETLRIENMGEWEYWDSCGVEFRSLHKLSIKECSKLLGKLPSCLSSLEELVINGCPQLVVLLTSLPRITNLEIQLCKEVECGSEVDFGSLNWMVLDGISNIKYPTKRWLMQGLRRLRYFLLAGDCRAKQSPSPTVTHTPGWQFTKCPQFISMVLDYEDKRYEEKEQLQQALTASEVEILELKCCETLEKLPQWMHNLKSLSRLTIEDCPKLGSLSDDAGFFSTLKAIKIGRCNALAPQLDEVICRCTCLEELEIQDCDSLKPFGRGQLPPTLKQLQIRGCENFRSLLDDGEASSFSSSSSASGNGGNSSNLEFLEIVDCSNLTSLSSRCESVAVLKHLSIEFCPNITSLFTGGKLPSRLQQLKIGNCSKMESIAESFDDHNAALERISIYSCSNLKALPNGLHKIINLHRISIYGCESLVRFPNGGLPTTCLKEFRIHNCKELEALPENMHNLLSLQKLEITNCPKIVSFPEEGFPTNLITLEIRNLSIYKQVLHRLTILRELYIEGGCEEVVCFPQDEIGMMLPTSLTTLSIEDFPNLKYLSSKGFQNLTSLQFLYFSNCPRLISFPKEGLPLSLLALDIDHCPLLAQSCQRGKGKDWSKIAHIPCIIINNRWV